MEKIPEHPRKTADFSGKSTKTEAAEIMTRRYHLDVWRFQYIEIAI
jgi:hypothetical protein